MHIQSLISPWFFLVPYSKERRIFAMIFSLCVNVTIMFLPRHCISIFGSKIMWWVSMYISLFSDFLPLRVSFSVLARSQGFSLVYFLASLHLIPSPLGGGRGWKKNHILLGTVFLAYRAQEQVWREMLKCVSLPSASWASWIEPVYLVRTGLKSQDLSLQF